MPVALYTVEVERLQWFIRLNGRKFYGYDNGAEAIAAAIDAARVAGEWGFDSKVATLTGEGFSEIIWSRGRDAEAPGNPVPTRLPATSGSTGRILETADRQRP